MWPISIPAIDGQRAAAAGAAVAVADLDGADLPSGVEVPAAHTCAACLPSSFAPVIQEEPATTSGSTR